MTNFFIVNNNNNNNNKVYILYKNNNIGKKVKERDREKNHIIYINKERVKYNKKAKYCFL